MLKEFSYKQFGQLRSSDGSIDENTLLSIAENIKILFLSKNTCVKVDFQTFSLESDALLFINPKVKIQFLNNHENKEVLLHFNRDFYCIEIHDQEVACDGILYNNVFEVPFIELNEIQASNIRGIIEEIQFEMENEDANTEEMLRIFLKLIILKSTRIWKEKHRLSEDESRQDVHFLRKFSKLVEENYKTHHAVADYAEMLFITPKSLSKKIGLLSKETPNDIIKNRIILESKRLLAHTNMTVKEIAYSLNYEDDAYFVRFFTKNTGISPMSFRKQF
jgi:AraC family transcriptional regulator, transcriptional activator of pobA